MAKDVIMLAITRRCGSTMLRSVLQQNNNIVVENEVFRPFINLSIDKKKEAYTSTVQNIILRIDELGEKTCYLYTVSAEDIINLENFNLINLILPTKILFLYRENILEQYSSNELAKIFNSFNDTKEIKKLKSSKRLFFNNLLFNNYIFNMRRAIMTIINFIKKHKINYQVYEYNSINKNLKKIFNFIGLEYKNEVPKTIKSETRNLKDIFINFSNIKTDYKIDLTRAFQDIL